MAKKNKAIDTRMKNEAMASLEEAGFSREDVKAMLTEAVKTAYSKICADAVLEVQVDDKFNIKAQEVRTVVENDKDDYEDFEITLEDAQAINPNYQIGDQIRTDVDIDIFGRTDTSKIKNMMKQKIRETQKTKDFEYFKEKENEIITGSVERIDPNGNYAIIDLGLGQTASLNKKNMIPGEKLMSGQQIKVYVESVEDEKPDFRKNAKIDEDTGEVKKKKGIFIQISRRTDQLVKRLFEENVTEIMENGRPGPVEILAIARDPGKRCKVAVTSTDPNVDPIGACVGQKGIRSKTISDELSGEKIDIVKYDRNLKKFIANALSPAQVNDPEHDVIINEATGDVYVIVPDDKSSLAIGKMGINTKLASKLISQVASSRGRDERWNIKIKSETAAESEGIRFNDFKEIFLRDDQDEFESLDNMISDIQQTEAMISKEDIAENQNDQLVEIPVVEETAPIEEKVEKVEIPVAKETIEEKEEPVIPEFDQNVEDLISEINSDLEKVNSSRDEIEFDIDDENDDYDDDEYLDTLSEYEDLYN